MNADEHTSLTGITDRLAARFPTVPRAEIADLIAATHGRFSTARIRSYVPLLVENLVRDALAVQMIHEGRQAQRPEREPASDPIPVRQDQFVAIGLRSRTS